MSKKSTLPVRPTANQVRAAVKSDPRHASTLSDKALHNLNSRGRLGAEVVGFYNKGKVSGKRYVTGNTKAAKVEAQTTRANLREQGLAGKRGPLSKAAKAALAQNKG